MPTVNLSLHNYVSGSKYRNPNQSMEKTNARDDNAIFEIENIRLIITKLAYYAQQKISTAQSSDF